MVLQCYKLEEKFLISKRPQSTHCWGQHFLTLDNTKLFDEV